jgi:hypothetical protein
VYSPDQDIPAHVHPWAGFSLTLDGGYDEAYDNTGMVIGFSRTHRQARWEGAAPPRADYLEDAHAEEFHRPYPQHDPQRFAATAREMLNGK